MTSLGAVRWIGLAIATSAGACGDCPSIDPAIATVVAPTAGHCVEIPQIAVAAATACGVDGDLYVARAAPGSGALDLDIVLGGGAGDTQYVSASVGGSCFCGPVGDLGDPGGDWGILATSPADGTAVAERIGPGPGGGVWACTHLDRPPGGVVGPLRSP